jgi:uridine kinase
MIRKNIIIGIVGTSGAGKTTLVKKLKLIFRNSEHIQLDNYFKSPKILARKNGFPNWELPSSLKFNVLLKHLVMLKSGYVVHTKTFPKRVGAKKESLVLKPKQLIVAEGFMLFKDKKVRDMFDVKIYLDIPPALMLKRRAIRFGNPGERPTEYDMKVAIPEFLKYGITQKKYADYLIDATQPQSKVVKEVQRIIKEELKK